MKIFSPTISRLARLRHWRIEEWMASPVAIQREVLQDLVTHGQNTIFGRKYGFQGLFGTRQFKAAVPIHEYPDIKPYIDRIMQGEENVLWNTPVNWFAKSSGTTTDKSKFIPITTESLENCHYQAAKDVLTLHYHNQPESDLLTGKGLVIGGSHQVSQLNEEIFYGDLSAVLLQNTPFWGQWLRTPELSIALMDEWEAKLEALAQSTIKEDVTSISGVPTWTLILLKRILEITGKQTIKEVWPNLELYMHGGVSFTPYREQFQQLLGNHVSYLEMYNASEGFFAVQDIPGGDGMLLLLNHGIFYEFMPIEEYGKADPKTIGLRDVELHKNYAPVISTNGGLWRYLLGDTIQFTSLFPFRIKVSGRIRHFINAFGEELIVDNADQAIDHACHELNCQIAEYTAAPIYFSDHGNGAHEWLIEFEKAPEDMDRFTDLLDQKLQQLNSDYEAKRHKSIALGLPVIRKVPPRTFNRWLKSKNKLGGQHKVPRLSNDRKYIEEIDCLLAAKQTLV
ncbi:GH3 auxin-responsive promoter [Arachidicoccus rhizosphaerae]|uniref:GH3 auxin-responsive promoter n=1 Tax=Arachidicoccus rhizosphaerae TaxID=551991 RepID=A0A1H3ZJ34_9BACT|nr:GH3 auxin-responsive promoter family protein [Arachidicoccus rhizosphaerae]SEA23776.1 GH3 auxin-responsive promoter [Arachidicoccus rhizosphaerae]